MAAYIGTATSRIDGIAKVTGAAKYAAEFNAPGLLHGSVVTATIAKGRIGQIDRSAAMGVKGVIDILTHDHRPQMADDDQAYKDEVAPDGSPFRPLYDDKIKFGGQPIALVVAETSEIARFAASLVRVEYEQEGHVTDVFSRRDAAILIKPPTDPAAAPFGPQKTRGNPEQALAASAVHHEREYYVPIEHHNPMELYAATAIYEANGKLTVYDKTQGVQNVQRYLCGALALKSQDVRVVSPFMGGGFGSGLRPQYEAALAAMAALALKRSVRVVLTRPQMYGLGYRPAMIQRIALGAGADGTLDAITHSAVTVTSQFEDFYRQETGWSGLLYKSANAKYTHRLAHLDLATPCDMRAPSAATGVYALESAMDELAVALNLDPVELRLRCYSDRDQHTGHPYASKALRECYRQGAIAFGWAERNPRPRSMRDGTDLVGWGMATGIWEALQIPISVRIVLTANGHAEVACATSDIGTGTYTIMAQVAADMLGLPLDASRFVPIADAMRHGDAERIEQEKTTEPTQDQSRAHNTHSAIFAEVKLDEQLGVIRVTRVVSAVAAGRILNTKTATSQILGGVVWGIGMALHEETLIDHRFGRIMNANIAEYHVPVNADVQDIEVIFVEEPDDSNRLGLKGLGEIGIVGVAAAIANAVYHATGKRVRDLPITLDKLTR